MIEYIQAHQAGFWIALGFLLLAVEVLITGFSTIVLLFAGLGAVATGLLIMAGILPQTWLAGIATFGISTGVLSALLWGPMKRFQDKSEPQNKQSSDFVGLEFVCNSDISLTQPGSHKYSGITWKVEIDTDTGLDQIANGTPVVVSEVNVGLFKVKPKIV
ncbi:MAG: NfeD family protein [Gammaproteobacteria bacterium]|nr:NfeD family protein [Gammaproteobacteria bacterium]MDH5803143.1 NfeD family protein [Gammaproteobacteria bacterium]